MLLDYDFSGTVRELENIIQRSVVAARGRTINGQNNLQLSKDDRLTVNSGVISIEKTVCDRTGLTKTLSTFERLLLMRLCAKLIMRKMPPPKF
jgi:transcriptional regulator with GAF, ATPase, and Fis domain